jgi:hypothetical protein
MTVLSLLISVLKFLVLDQPSSRHVIGGVVMVSETALPLLSLAGMYLARRRMMLHVAASNALLPLERMMEQLATRPSGPIVIDA